MQLPHPGSCLQMLWCWGVLIQQAQVNDCTACSVILMNSLQQVADVSFPYQHKCSDCWVFGRCPNLLFFFSRIHTTWTLFLQGIKSNLADSTKLLLLWCISFCRMLQLRTKSTLNNNKKSIVCCFCVCVLQESQNTSVPLRVLSVSFYFCSFDYLFLSTFSLTFNSVQELCFVYQRPSSSDLFLTAGLSCLV